MASVLDTQDVELLQAGIAVLRVFPPVADAEQGKEIAARLQAVVAAPELVMAVDRSNGVILDYRLAMQGNKVEAARQLLADLTCTDEGPEIIAAELADAVDDAISACGQGARFVLAGGSTLLTTILGDSIGTIAIRHRRRPPSAIASAQTLDAADAVVALRQAVRAHNAARLGG